MCLVSASIERYEEDKKENKRSCRLGFLGALRRRDRAPVGGAPLNRIEAVKCWRRPRTFTAATRACVATWIAAKYLNTPALKRGFRPNFERRLKVVTWSV